MALHVVQSKSKVSILVLMDSRVKTLHRRNDSNTSATVSILVLMDSRVKTIKRNYFDRE